MNTTQDAVDFGENFASVSFDTWDERDAFGDLAERPDEISEALAGGTGQPMTFSLCIEESMRAGTEWDELGDTDERDEFVVAATRAAESTWRELVAETVAS